MMRFGFKIVTPKNSDSFRKKSALGTTTTKKENQKNYFRILFNPKKLMKNIGLPVIMC